MSPFLPINLMANNKKLSLVLYVISTLVGAISGYFGIRVTTDSSVDTDGSLKLPPSLVIKQ